MTTSPEYGMFAPVYDRICAATGSADELELAKALERRYSEVASAVRDAVVPLDWLIRLWQRESISPRWILEGTGPQRLPLPATPEERAAQCREVSDFLEETLALWEPLCFSPEYKRIAALLDKKIHLVPTF